VSDLNLEVALGEIELCQMHIDNSSQRTWQSGALLLAGALAALGFALQVTGSEIAAATITTAFAVGAVAILLLWISFVARQNDLQHASILRMRSLEASLGMARQQAIQAADARAAQSIVTRWGTTAVLQAIGWITLFGWVTVAVWRWLIYAGVLD
jgi:hypothetical protein